MSRKKTSRNAPCPCGSGKNYKHCCYGKGDEDDLGLGSGRQQPQHPVGTVALYGPDDKTTTKIAAGVILHDGAEPIMKWWVATDVMTNPKVRQEMKDFFLQHGVQSVAMSQGNWGCPHEEGEDCPFTRSGRASRRAIGGTDQGQNHAKPGRSALAKSRRCPRPARSRTNPQAVRDRLSVRNVHRVSVRTHGSRK